MRKLFTILSLCAVTLVPAKDIYVNSPSTTLLLKAEQDRPLHVSYYGERVADAEQVKDMLPKWDLYCREIRTGCYSRLKTGGK